MQKEIVIYKNIAEGLVEKLKSHNYKVTQFSTVNDSNRDEFHKSLLNASGIVGTHVKVNEDLLKYAPSLKAVSTVSVGYDDIDVDYMSSKGIAVMHTPNVLNDSVADLIMSLVLTTSRKIVFTMDYMRDHKWNGPLPLNCFGQEVHHKKIGIVGMGRIGEVVAKRCKLGFDMEVSYYSRTQHKSVEDLYGAKHLDLDTLLKESDFVIVILPSTPQTKHMFSHKQFEMMKKSAIFINAGRGPVVDEEALIEALKSNKIAGAGLDVYEKEPLDKKSQLLTLENVVVVPHIGSCTSETRNLMAECAVDNVINALNGNIEKNCVNYNELKNK
ncbi:hypothetical protein DICPUDRAFT_52429 [Dictyostelium purpureum]|uniref:Uncharacterized protein n=1 Tax=Dictyostelium purpureum TaxID=5786 RepID=F0Z8B1_DICPU|nr:uncharacterized protein DICPUDRAFT_52429 [Dictyostelium purpureum]EGC39784.1 hypothetical protein DICPUDRAFT_52429 [Dictyostelium purpureum]|eukprot:XP_003283651.1 hypothetical protein DICPUDRAFT_52429 [Dictyostelium purpureum]